MKLSELYDLISKNPHNWEFIEYELAKYDMIIFQWKFSARFYNMRDDNKICQEIFDILSKKCTTKNILKIATISELRYNDIVNIDTVVNKLYNDIKPYITNDFNEILLS